MAKPKEDSAGENVADGVKVDDPTRQLLARVRKIEAAMRQVTLNAKRVN